MNVALWMSRFGIELVFEVLARAWQFERAGREIVHFEIGEFDFDMLAYIKDVVKQVLDVGVTHYGLVVGLFELREVIVKYVIEMCGIVVVSEEVVVMPGAKPIMFFMIMVMIGEGDEVIHP